MKREKIESLIRSLEELRLQEDRLIRQIREELSLEPAAVGTAQAEAPTSAPPDGILRLDGSKPPQYIKLGDRVEFTRTPQNPAGVGHIHSWLGGGYCWIRRESWHKGLFGTETVKRLTTNTFKLPTKDGGAKSTTHSSAAGRR